jgi:hypothetical protein
MIHVVPSLAMFFFEPGRALQQRSHKSVAVDFSESCRFIGKQHYLQLCFIS